MAQTTKVHLVNRAHNFNGTAESLAGASESSGKQSQPGATWRGAYTATMNSGFAWGTPRTDNYKGVREGREEGFGPQVKGVGRTGKSPLSVPPSMLMALGVLSDNTTSALEEETKLKKPRTSRLLPAPKDDVYSQQDNTAPDELGKNAPSENMMLKQMNALNDGKNRFVKVYRSVSEWQRGTWDAQDIVQKEDKSTDEASVMKPVTSDVEGPLRRTVCLGGVLPISPERLNECPLAILGTGILLCIYYSLSFESLSDTRGRT